MPANIQTDPMAGKKSSGEIERTDKQTGQVSDTPVERQANEIDRFRGKADRHSLRDSAIILVKITAEATLGGMSRGSMSREDRKITHGKESIHVRKHEITHGLLRIDKQQDAFIIVRQSNQDHSKKGLIPDKAHEIEHTLLRAQALAKLHSGEQTIQQVRDDKAAPLL